MQIVTAADEKYAPLADTLRQSAERMGYPVHVWDLGGGFGTPFIPQPKGWDEVRRWKPRYVLAGRKKFEGPLVYVDSDSVIVRPFGEILDGSFDIGFSVKKKKSGEDRIRVKAGMVFMHDTAEAHRFLGRWIAKVGDRGYRDQYALWELIEEHYDLTHAIYGEILKIDGVLVKLFPREAGLCVEMRDPGDVKNAPEWAKILHFSGRGKDKFPSKMRLAEEYVCNHGK